MFEFTLAYPSDTIIIGEAAHFGTPRTKLSKAQYYTADELLNWYESLESAGIQLYLSSERETYKYRSRVKLDKGDLNDLLSIECAIKENPNLLKNMKKPVKTFIPKDRVLEGNRARKEWGDDANIARTFNYSHPDDLASKWLYDNIFEIMNRCDPETCKILRLEEENLFWQKNDKKTGRKKGDLKSQFEMLHNGKNAIKLRASTIVSVLFMLMDINGKPRVRESTGCLSGWDFIKNEVLLAKAHRPRSGGVIRSTIYHHGLTNYTCEMLNTREGQNKKPIYDYSVEQLKDRKKVVKQWNNAIKDLFMVMKSMIQEQFKDELAIIEYVEKEKRLTEEPPLQSITT